MEKLIEKHWNVQLGETRKSHSDITAETAIGFTEWMFINCWSIVHKQNSVSVCYNGNLKQSKKITELFTIYINQL